jgi:hypothetical protein
LSHAHNSRSHALRMLTLIAVRLLAYQQNPALILNLSF